MKEKTFDEAKAKSLINQMQQHQTEQQLNQMKREHAIFQVLTPSQQTQFLQDRANPPKNGKKAAKK